MTKKEKTVVAVFALIVVVIIAVTVAASMIADNKTPFSNSTAASASVSTDTASQTQNDNTVQSSAADVTETTSSAAASQANDIGVEKAKSIAVEDSGQANNTSIIFTKQKKDYENGKYVYDIEFHDYVTEYEYEIEVSTGSIISRSTEPYDD